MLRFKRGEVLRESESSLIPPARCSSITVIVIRFLHGRASPPPLRFDPAGAVAQSAPSPGAENRFAYILRDEASLRMTKEGNRQPRVRCGASSIASNAPRNLKVSRGRGWRAGMLAHLATSVTSGVLGVGPGADGATGARFLSATGVPSCPPPPAIFVPGFRLPIGIGSRKWLRSTSRLVIRRT